MKPYRFVLESLVPFDQVERQHDDLVEENELYKLHSKFDFIGKQFSYFQIKRILLINFE